VQYELIKKHKMTIRGLYVFK